MMNVECWMEKMKEMMNVKCWMLNEKDKKKCWMLNRPVGGQVVEWKNKWNVEGKTTFDGWSKYGYAGSFQRYLHWTGCWLPAI